MVWNFSTIQHFDTSPPLPSQLGWTPLMRTANSGNRTMVALLLQHPRVVVNAHSPVRLEFFLEALGGQ